MMVQIQSPACNHVRPTLHPVHGRTDLRRISTGDEEERDQPGEDLQRAHHAIGFVHLKREHINTHVDEQHRAGDDLREVVLWRGTGGADCKTRGHREKTEMS
jgi:hypothetical protein